LSGDRDFRRTRWSGSWAAPPCCSFLAGCCSCLNCWWDWGWFRASSLQLARVTGKHSMHRNLIWVRGSFPDWAEHEISEIRKSGPSNRDLRSEQDS
jgi:hypothetical protein